MRSSRNTSSVASGSSDPPRAARPASSPPSEVVVERVHPPEDLGEPRADVRSDDRDAGRLERRQTLLVRGVDRLLLEHLQADDVCRRVLELDAAPDDVDLMDREAGGVLEAEQAVGEVGPPAVAGGPRTVRPRARSGSSACSWSWPGTADAVGAIRTVPVGGKSAGRHRDGEVDDQTHACGAAPGSRRVTPIILWKSKVLAVDLSRLVGVLRSFRRRRTRAGRRGPASSR